jgi:hypothetical protein
MQEEIFGPVSSLCERDIMHSRSTILLLDRW